MMKQTRIIRISFLICTICMVVAFWSGFYFGESQLKADTAPVQTASCPDTDSEKSSTEEKKNISGTDSVESMNHLSEEKYYVKVSGEYLSVYFSDTDRLYFETSLKVSNLPEYLRRDALEGIPFTSLEKLAKTDDFSKSAACAILNHEMISQRIKQAQNFCLQIGCRFWRAG